MIPTLAHGERENRPNPRRVIFLARVTLVALLAGGVQAKAGEPCALEASSSHTVVRVIDAETLALDDGSEVRLIGALPPRRSDGPAAQALETLARETLAHLVLGRRIELRSGGRRTDRYGRHLAQVFVPEGAGITWVQGRLVEAGLARAYALPGNDACLADMIAKEREARQNSRELWSNSLYFVLNSHQVRELLTLRGRFVLAEGRVQAAAERGGRVYLNFGSDWRQDFTASVPPRLMRGDKAAASFLRGLEGRLVRVRGWIERRNGPFIEVASLADIEVLDAQSQAGAAADPSPHN